MPELTDLSKEYADETPSDLHEPKSFQWYLDRVVKEPEIARNAHQRVADMFDFFGKEFDEEQDVVKYTMVSEDPLNDGAEAFFGTQVHESIHEFVNKVKGGSRGLGPEKRIKLLLGPVGSGKSAFDQLVQEYFEHYTRLDAGRMYTFRWVNLCSVIDDQDPSDDVQRSAMNQDPLVLLPENQRQKVLEEANENLTAPYRLRNEQAPDPLSAFYLKELLQEYDNDLSKVIENHVEVIRLVADHNQRQCIETFEPKDKKNQDETELTGDVNYSKLAVYGESDPRAFDYSGAFCNANRGLFSGEELLKLQREFLYDFLHATQEQTIKPKNNPRIDIDQVIVGRTNMPEYIDKTGDEAMEAFNDRTKRIDYPYVLEYAEESKIYKKKLNNADIPDVNVEPHTLEMAGLFAVLTRIMEPADEEVTLVEKARAYNGEARTEFDVEKLQDEGEEQAEVSEGMSGISPRFITDEISEAIMDNQHRGKSYISPLTLFNYFEENLESHGSIQEERLPTYMRYMELVREEYEERAIDDVRTALAYDMEEIQEQGEKYIDHVMAYIDDEEIQDELTGQYREPDEEFMRSIEEKIDIPKDRSDAFRQEISNWISRRARADESFKPQDNRQLQRALERKNWEDKKHNINFGALISDEKETEGQSEWIEALKDMGYSEEGAQEVLEFAGAQVARTEIEENQ